MPTHEDYPWERDERKWSKRRPYTPPRSYGSHQSYQRYQRSSSYRAVGRSGRRLVTLFLLVVAIAGLVQYGRHGPSGSGGLQVVTRTPTQSGTSSRLPGAYIAEPGPWRWRWVRVENPPLGAPGYVRQRYRTIRYVPAIP
jgi:hypothetical protein